MAALPVVSGEQAVRVFQNAGWRKDRQRGSHVVLLSKGSLPVWLFRNIVSWLLARSARSFVLRA